ncbi:hypothetical protein AB0N88_34640, partial [Streptomyces sp. NPDC093516]|uniref:hypothetical protein n=1 Tax=Streptomyces sp. NPDC093516 TaxID=3155304 RepID=UPI003421AD77
MRGAEGQAVDDEVPVRGGSQGGAEVRLLPGDVASSMPSSRSVAPNSSAFGGTKAATLTNPPS